MKIFLRTLLAIVFTLAGLFLILGAAVYAANSALASYNAANPVYLQAAAPRFALSLLEPAGLAQEQAAQAENPTVESAVSVQAVTSDSGTIDGQPLPSAAVPEATSPIPSAAAPEATSSPASTPEPTEMTSLPTSLPTVADAGSPPASTQAGTPAAPEPKSQPTPFQSGSQPTPRPTLLPEFVERLLSALPRDLFPPTPTPPPTPGAGEFAYPSYTETAPPAANPPAAEAPADPAAPANPAPIYTPSEPIVRISIPRLKVKRTVVDIGMNGQEWDTDSLFATRNRPDLVGHLEGSALPGEEGNTVLVGHNYDYNGAGVFVNLDNLRDGDEITLFTEGGQEFTYQVVKVKSVPYSGGQEIDRHQHFLDPRGEERLTLVTCGGVNIGFFNRRVYVVAYPVTP